MLGDFFPPVVFYMNKLYQGALMVFMHMLIFFYIKLILSCERVMLVRINVIFE